MTKPVVAALHGTALGGGFEVALTCHWRVAVDSGQVGLPEVKLGVIPGSGGTQRLPRLIGPKLALDMIVPGNPIPAKKAAELGVIDEIVGDLLPGALAFAKKVVAEKRPLRLVRNMNDRIADVDPAVFEDYRKSIARKAKGFLAPWRCIDAVEAATKLPIDEGLKKEREFFFECMDSPQRKAQIHAFFAEREAAKIPDLPADVKPKQIRSAAVLGAGTMGGGIAMNFANAGIPVKLLDVSQEALSRGLGVIEKNYATSVARGSMKQEAMDRAMKLITGTQHFEDIGDADIVVEAVFEEMGVKKEVFGKLDRVMKPGAVLATNTSTLDIDEIAASTKRPQDVIGTHFFSPANVMKLLENVRGAKSSPETIATVMALGKSLKKVAVLAGNCDGFIGNRMLHGYLREANFLLEEGASPQQVDAALENFGLAMGPFRMGDLAGLDVGWRIRKGKAHLRPADERYSPSPTGSAKWAGSARKPAPASTATRAATPFPIPSPTRSSWLRRRSKALNGVRFPMRRSSSAACIRWSTKAPAFLRKASLSAPAISTSPTFSAMASPSIGAGRCSGPSRSASTRCSPRSAASTRSTANSGNRHRFWCSGPKPARDGTTAERHSPPERHSEVA